MACAFRVGRTIRDDKEMTYWILRLHWGVWKETGEWWLCRFAVSGQPVEVGSLSILFTWFFTVVVWDVWTINSISKFFSSQVSPSKMGHGSTSQETGLSHCHLFGFVGTLVYKQFNSIQATENRQDQKEFPHVPNSNHWFSRASC